MTFAELSTEAQADLRRRLARLDLDEKALISDELSVGAGTVVRLSMDGTGAINPRVLHSGDLDKVRQWIGVPEAAAGKLAGNTRRLKGVMGARSSTNKMTVRAKTGAVGLNLPQLTGITPEALLTSVTMFKSSLAGERRARRVTSSELELLRGAAASYVRGDKELVAPYKRAIEAHFGPFMVASWCFVVVRVARNSVLEFGPGVNALTAHKVILEPGARIRSYGHLTVDCYALEREKSLLESLPDHVLDLKQVSRLIPRGRRTKGGPAHV